jgi:hypothetical protein
MIHSKAVARFVDGMQAVQGGDDEPAADEDTFEFVPRAPQGWTGAASYEGRNARRSTAGTPPAKLDLSPRSD